MSFVKVLLAICALAMGVQQSFAQPAESWNLSKSLARNGVETIHRFTYFCQNGEPVESCPNGTASINHLGLISSYIEHRACGMVCAEQFFTYNEKGILTESTVTHISNQFEPMAFVHEYNGDRLISRTTSHPIRGYWEKESYVYNSSGKISMVKQWNFQNDRWLLREEIVVKVGRERKKNTPSYIFDETGMLLVHNVYANNGLRRIEKFFYSFR